MGDVIIAGCASPQWRNIKRESRNLAERCDAQRELQNIASPDLINNNEIFHRYLTEGITVKFHRNGETKGEQLWLS
jgi:type I site-specific restriction-modification system R (restriction) subunit